MSQKRKRERLTGRIWQDLRELLVAHREGHELQSYVVDLQADVDRLEAWETRQFLKQSRAELLTATQGVYDWVRIQGGDTFSLDRLATDELVELEALLLLLFQAGEQFEHWLKRCSGD